MIDSVNFHYNDEDFMDDIMNDQSSRMNKHHNY